MRGRRHGSYRREMWAPLLAFLVETAAACSCARPPFQVVGASWAERREELRGWAMPVDRRPTLVVSHATTGRPEVRIHRGRFVPLGGGRAVPARILRTWVPERHGSAAFRSPPTWQQAELSPVRDLAPGDHRFELPARARVGWEPLGVRVRVLEATPTLTETPFTAEWAWSNPGSPGDCQLGGWSLLLSRGPGFEGGPPSTAWDVYVTDPGATDEHFWLTLEGSDTALVIGDTDSCGRYAYGEEAPAGGARLRLVPRVTGAAPSGGQVVTLPERVEPAPPAHPP